MSSFDLVAIVPLELTTFAIAVFAGVVAFRVVEQPNSHYTSQLARDNETRHRWSNIALDRMHEVNRGEVERLLAKVEATSVDALRPNEREFLDRMAELADARPPAGPGGKERQGAPDLRHRPA